MSSAVTSQVNQVEMVKCYEYTIENYYGEEAKEIFVPAPYLFCVNQDEMVFSDKARNIYKPGRVSYEQKEDSDEEHPLTEKSMEKSLADRIYNLIKLKQKIMEEEDYVEEAIGKYWKTA